MSKIRKVLYWISTIWLGLGMLTSAIMQISRAVPEVVGTMTRLGYPSYMLTILGVWKILGVAVILAPRLPIVKEWAYAGFFFVASGALISHVVMGDPFGETFPSVLLLTLTIVSWYLRPPSRKVN